MEKRLGSIVFNSLGGAAKNSILISSKQAIHYKQL
jgi:hypothetical protein